VDEVDIPLRRSRRHDLRWSALYKPGEIEVGDVMLVAYDPAAPDQHVIDRFDARQEDRLRLLAEAEQHSTS
jgi:hypothetical protein